MIRRLNDLEAEFERNHPVAYWIGCLFTLLGLGLLAWGVLVAF